LLGDVTLHNRTSALLFFVLLGTYIVVMKVDWPGKCKLYSIRGYRVSVVPVRCGVETLRCTAATP